MIVRERPHGLALFFVLRGSVLPSILPVLMVNILFATAITWLHGELLHQKIQVTTVPFSLIGLTLAIFLGFRNSAAYDRYWEARKIWGSFIFASRSFGRQVMSYVQPATDLSADPSRSDPRHAVLWQVAGAAHALRHQLRRSDALPDLQRCLGSAQGSSVWPGLAASQNQPTRLLQAAGEQLGRWCRSGELHPSLAPTLEDSLTVMTAAAASCERIRGTPIPFAYTLLLHRTAYMYCFLLPFGLVDLVHGMTPVVVALVAYTIFGLDALGDDIEEPFGTKPNDLPLDALCAHIEIYLREAMGETDLPRPPVPVDFQLT
jgi:putative membrane protein